MEIPGHVVGAAFEPLQTARGSTRPDGYDPGAIVERVETVGYVGRCELSILVDRLFNPLHLQAAEEGSTTALTPLCVKK